MRQKSTARRLVSSTSLDIVMSLGDSPRIVETGVYLMLESLPTLGQEPVLIEPEVC